MAASIALPIGAAIYWRAACSVYFCRVDIAALFVPFFANIFGRLQDAYGFAASRLQLMVPVKMRSSNNVGNHLSMEDYNTSLV